MYTKLTAEIEAQAKQAASAQSQDEQIRIFDAIGAKLEAFRAKYPETPEALDATFQLGAMKSGMQQYDQAEKYLVEFVKAANATEDREKLAYAHFYLAEAYKSSGKYDAAEGEYKLIMKDYADVNPRLTSYAQTSLETLGSERMLAIGGEPIAFDVKSIRGERLSPSAYRGKVLLIDFWATWCGPCIAEMPNVKSVYAKFHPQGFEIVGISLDQSRDKLDKYIESQEIAWPQYFDGKWWNNDIAVRYGIKSIPSTILVDKKGKIRYKSLRGKQLENAVQELLNEKV
jgi:thiol-disulfide isomerase/thioredoxin